MQVPDVRDFARRAEAYFREATPVIERMAKLREMHESPVFALDPIAGTITILDRVWSSKEAEELHAQYEELLAMLRRIHFADETAYASAHMGG